MFIKYRVKTSFCFCKSEKGIFAGCAIALLLFIAVANIAIMVMSAVLSTASAGTVSMYGGYQYLVTANSKAGIEQMQADSAAGAAIGIVNESGQILNPNTGLVANTELTLTAAPLQQGRIIAGMPANKIGEAVVSRAVAEQLQLHIGDKIVVATTGNEPGFATVSGISLNIADTSMQYALVRQQKESTAWLLHQLPNPIPLVYGTGMLNLKSIPEIAATYRNEVAGRSSSTVVLLLFFLTLLTVTTVPLTVFVLRRKISLYRAIVISQGARPTAALGIFLFPVLVVAIAVIISATVGTYLFVSSGSAQISQLFNQQWEKPAVFKIALFTAIGEIAGSFLIWLICFIILGKRKPIRWSLPQVKTKNISRYLVIAGFLFSISALLFWGVGLQFVMPLLLLSSCLFLPGCGYWFALVGFRPVMRKIQLRNFWFICLPLTIVGLIVVYTSYFAAFTNHQLTSFKTEVATADSFFNVRALDLSTINQLASKYPQIMQEAYLFQLPEEGTTLVRAVKAQQLSCFLEQRDTNICRGSGLSPVGVAVSPPANQLVFHASSYLADNAGQVALAHLKTGSSKVEAAQLLNGISSSEILNNNYLPGLVLPANAQLLQQYGVALSSQYALYSLNFATYPEQVQQDFRRDIYQLSPQAVVVQATSHSTNYAQVRVVILLVLATLLMSAVLLLIFSSYRSSNQELFALVAQIKTSQVSRLHILLPVFCASFSVTVILPVIGRLLVIPGLSLQPLIQAGWLWAMPEAGVIVLLLGFFASGFTMKQ